MLHASSSGNVIMDFPHSTEHSAMKRPIYKLRVRKVRMDSHFDDPANNQVPSGKPSGRGRILTQNGVFI